MMLTADRSFGAMRLAELKQTMDSLNGRLRELQWELDRVKAKSLSIRLWRNLASRKGRQEYMSAVCNRHARPNTKMVSHAGPRL